MWDAFDKSFTDAALDSLRDIFYMVEYPSARMVRWNRALVEHSGYSDEEISRMTVFDFFDEEGKQRQGAFIAELIRKGQASIEVEAVSKDGGRRPYEFYATLVEDPETRRPVAVVGIGRDLSERCAVQRELAEYENALAASEVRFRTIADSSLFGIVLLDASGIAYMNDKIVEITGYPREYFTITGEVFHMLLPEYRGFFGESLQRLISGEPIPDHAYARLTRRDGEIADVMASMKLVDISGNRSLLLTFVDITEQRKTEHALRESEERYKTLLQTSPDAVSVVDAGGKIVYLSDYALELLGGTREEWIGTEAITLLPRDQYDFANEEFAQLLEQGMVRNVRHQVRRRDGSTLNLETSVTAVRDEDGALKFMTVVSRDIAARLQMEKNLRRSQQQARAMGEIAEKRAQQLSDVVSIAAHELRHPATIFKGYSELLLSKRDALNGEAAQQALESINKASDRLAQLVGNLLELSNIDAERIVLTCADTNPGELARWAVNAVTADGAENLFYIEAPADLLPVCVDANRIVQALAMLLDNAVKFSPEGSAIDMIVEQDEGETVFSVHDRGVGIPETSLDFVFDRFYQVDEPKHHSKEGMGLGLYIARSIIEAHGGWIRARRREGEGSTISFGIPNDIAQLASEF